MTPREPRGHPEQGRGVIWVNGERRSDEGPHVSARDRGLTLSDGVFETMRAHRGTVFRLDRHLARLSSSLRRLDIPEPPEVREWVAEALRSADFEDARVRLTVTRGEGPPGVLPPADVRPTVLIGITAVAGVPATLAGPGVSAHVASGRRNEFSITAGLKTAAYIDNVAALIEARRSGADEALFLDVEGHCSEGTASNLFIWRDGVLTTPPLSCGALPGITRATLLELAPSLGVETAERAFGLEELQTADEAFLTNSFRAVAPLIRVNGKPIGSGVPGATTDRIAAAYAELFARECAAVATRTS